MNFVIFSFHFLPLSGAESFCTTRFASALAETGNSVHVVTMDWPSSVSPEIYDFLVDKRLKITRIPLLPKRRDNRARLRYLTTEWESVNYPAAIFELKRVLDSYDSPILISRSMPESSHIIAWHCRKHAAKWIAHFSDPTPFEHFGKCIRERLWFALSKRWVAKTLSAADGVSITCRQAERFFHEFYGKAFDELPMHVTNHIGYPKLPVREKWNRPCAEKVVVHSGMLYGYRGEKQLAEALDIINANETRLRFVQIGECANSVAFFAGRKDVEVRDSTSPSEAAAIVEGADISYIPDVQSALPYTPFIPSKFAYQLFSDKPLVIYTRPGSPMHEFCVRYPDAGLYYANYNEQGSLERAISCAAKNAGAYDRTAVRGEFMPGAVAKGFCDFVFSLLKSV